MSSNKEKAMDVLNELINENMPLNQRAYSDHTGYRLVYLRDLLKADEEPCQHKDVTTGVHTRTHCTSCGASVPPVQSVDGLKEWAEENRIALSLIANDGDGSREIASILCKFCDVLLESKVNQ